MFIDLLIIDLLPHKRIWQPQCPTKWEMTLTNPLTEHFTRENIVDALRRTKNKLKEGIGLELIHNEQLVAAFTNVEKHIKLLLK